MKKILMLLLILSSIAFASDQEGTGGESTDSTQNTSGSCYLQNVEESTDDAKSEKNITIHQQTYLAYLKCLSDLKQD